MDCNCRKRTLLCPVSLGLAAGITCAIAIFIWYVWMMYNGVPPRFADRIGEPTWSNAGIHALWVFVKAFLFGFFLALFYDLFSSICKSKCCRSGCTCSCCATNPSKKK